MLNTSEKQEKTAPDTKKPSPEQRLRVGIKTRGGNGVKMCIRHRRVNSDIFGVQGGRSCGCLQGARASVRSEPLTTTVGVREVSWFAGRGTETEELDCSTKESA